MSGVGGVGGGRPPAGAGSGVPSPKGKGRSRGDPSPQSPGSQSGSEIELLGHPPKSEAGGSQPPRPQGQGLPPRPRLRINIPPTPRTPPHPLGGAGSESPGRYPQQVPAPEQNAVTRSRITLEAALDRAHFPEVLTRPGNEGALNEQRDLQREYVAATAPKLAERRAMYGDDFAPERSQAAPWRGHGATVLVEALKGASLAMVRTPVTNTIATRLDPARGELTTSFDAIAVAAPLGGVAAYVADTLTQGIDRRAAAHNLAVLKPVDTKVLVPDASPIELTMRRDGRGGQIKHFHRRTGAEMAAERQAVQLRRNRIATQQTSLAGAGPVLTFLQGAISGGLNVVRRSQMSDSALLNPIKVGGLSAAAGGAAGFVTKAMNNIAKITPRLSQVEVDNLVGGHARMNLFVGKPPHTLRQPGGWNEVLPILKEAVQETGYLLGHTAVGLVAAGNDARIAQGADLARYVAAASATGVLSTAVGPLAAQISRDGQLDRRPGESLRSGASLLQQFAQSGVNDATWNALKNLLAAGLPHTNATAYDRTIAAHEAELRDAVPFARREAQRNLDQLRFVTREVDDPVLQENLGIVGGVLAVEPPVLADVRTALVLVEQVHQDNPAGGARQAAREVSVPLMLMRDSIAKIEQIERWRVAAPLREALPGGGRA